MTYPDLAGKAVIVTGAGAGIGLAIAERLERPGQSVEVLHRRQRQVDGSGHLVQHVGATAARRGAGAGRPCRCTAGGVHMKHAAPMCKRFRPVCAGSALSGAAVSAARR